MSPGNRSVRDDPRRRRTTGESSNASRCEGAPEKLGERGESGFEEGGDGYPPLMRLLTVLLRLGSSDVIVVGLFLTSFEEIDALR